MTTRLLISCLSILTIGITSAQAQTPGCMNADACNYNAANDETDNSCYFIGSPCDDSNASTINDKYTDCSTCVGTTVVLGCMDATACSYDNTANVNHNCKYLNDDCNDGDNATINDKLNGSCVCAGVAAVVGCMDVNACNYDISANIPGPCLNAFIVAGDPTGQVWTCSQAIADGEGDLPGSGVNYTKTWNADHGNGLGVLVDNDMNNNGFLDELEVYGCLEPAACNYKDPSVYGTTHTKAFSDSPNPCETVQYACEYCGQLNGDGEPIRYSNGNLNANQDAATGSEILVVDFENDGTPSATQGGLTAVAQHPLYRVIDGDTNNEGPCDGNDTYGCRAITACNYDPDASLQAEDTYDDATGTWIPACNMPGSCGCKTPGGVQFYPPVSEGGSAAPEADKDATVFDMPPGDCDCAFAQTDALGNCLLTSDGNFCLSDANANGICDDPNNEVYGCTDSTACNYNTAANVDNGSCLPPGTCGCTGETDGTGTVVDMPVGDCDCSGHQSDSLGVCGGTCTADANDNNLCDATENWGCMNPSACNYDETATYDDGCEYLDECGVCNGSGIPVGDCDCAGNQFDECDVCGGPCDVDLNNNNLDDDDEVQGCTDGTSCTYNELATYHVAGDCQYDDVCGVCGGSGIPVGNCNCSGDVIDECDVCGGTCTADTDNDNICDDVDICVGVGLVPDACGDCGGTNDGTDLACGCRVLPASACNCVPDGSGIAGAYTINYPDPGKNCDGTCLWGTDEFGDCLIYDNADPTSLLTPTRNNHSPGKAYKIVDPSDTEQWMADIDTLHARASKNLDDITLSGAADSLTIEDRIRSKGELIIEGISYLQDSLTVAKGAFITGDLEIGANLLVNGYARILGTTFSEGGLETTTLKMSESLHVGKSIYAGDSLVITGLVEFHDSLRVEDEISVGLRNQVVMDSTGAMTFDQGLVREDLQVRDSLIVNGTVDVGGNFKVHQTRFTVEAATGNTVAQGTLDVIGATTLGSTLDVTNNLRVYNSALERFKVDALNGNTTVGGTLSVTGNSTLSANADVGGVLTVSGSSTLTGATSMSSTLGVTGLATLSGGLTLLGNYATTLGGALTVTGATTLKSGLTLQGTTATTLGGALTVTGATNLNSAATVAGNFTHNGGEFHSKAGTFLVGSTASEVAPTGSTPAASTYAMVVDGEGNNNDNGILIRSGKATSDNALNFVTFLNSGNTVVGRIEGETLSELPNNAMYVAERAGPVMDVTAATVRLGFSIASMTEKGISMGFSIAGAIADVIPGAGLTDSDVAEGIKDGVESATKLASLLASIPNLISSISDLIQASITLGMFDSAVHSEIGVTYESSSGDYAEWIEKEDHRSDFLPGEIVGVRAGLLSYDTYTSDHNLVISTRPIVLGNMSGADESHYEKVAFLGQVPVRIQGEVNVGDFILPSGENNGYATAVSRDEIRFDQIPDIVGVAWESGLDPYFNMVNCSVGLDRQGTRQLTNLIQKEFEQIRESISGQIALSFVESGYAEQPQGKRWMKRRDKLATNEPMMSQNSASPVAVKPMYHSNTSIGIDHSASGPSTNQSNEDLEQLIHTNVQDIIEDYLSADPVISQDDWDIAAETIQLGFQDAMGALPSVINDGVNRPDVSRLIGDIHVPKKLQEMQAELTVAIFDAVLTPTRLLPMLRKEFQSGSPELLKAYPPGSAAEQEMIDNAINDVFKKLGQSMPYANKYTSKQ